MSYEKIYKDWEDSITHAHFIAVNIASDIDRIRDTISKRPRDIIHLPKRRYMEHALERLLGELATLGDYYVSPIQDLLKEEK